MLFMSCGNPVVRVKEKYLSLDKSATFIFLIITNKKKKIRNKLNYSEMLCYVMKNEIATVHFLNFAMTGWGVF